MSVRLRHPLDREILALALPALGALAADPLVTMVDTAFVGRLGVLPLAALGVNTSIFGLTFVVFNFLAYGTTPMVARAVGRGDVGRAGRLAVEALTLALLTGSVALALLLILAGPIASAMGARGELVDPALSYLRIRAFAGALSVRTFSLIATLTIATAVATRIGPLAVAAHQVAFQLWLLLALVVDALAVAGQAMVGRYRGAEQFQSARAAADRLLAWGGGVGCSLAVAFLVMAPWLPRQFTDDSPMIRPPSPCAGSCRS